MPDPEPPAQPPDQRLRELEQAIEALEAQRGVLGDAVVETALGPLRERRTALRGGTAGEQRRLVSVLFADLEGFTVLSRRLDAEDVRAVVARCFSAWQRVIEEHGGVVEKFIGDAVMAVFGLHRSHEDDAVRAVRAARALVASLGPVAEEVEVRHGAALHVRVGVDAGEVVVSTLGERAGHDFVAVGPTVNRASRLQGEAPRDGVLVSADVRRLLRGRFSLEPRPGLSLKGIDEPVDAFVVLRERPVGFDLEPTAGVGGVETTTVGRAVEQLTLREHLADVVDEQAWRITTVVGDAGVGKSRLLAEFDTWLSERPDAVWWFRGRASPSQQNRPHTLLRDALSTRFGITPDDDPATVLARCEAGFAAAAGASERTRRDALVVARWLGFEVGGPDAAGVPREPQALRDEASELLARYLARLGAEAPVVLLFEDLHWADDATLRWLEDAHEVLRDVPVLVVATARPALLELRPHWGEGLEHHRRLALGPLSRRESRQLLDQLLARVDRVPPELVALVVEGAEGNPFYIEELVTWLVDTGVVEPGPDGWRVRAEGVRAVRVPSTLRGVLQARLDGLEPDERQVLQRASVVGRVFWDAAVGRLGRGSPSAVGDGAVADDPVPALLDRLRGRDLVLRRPGSSIESAHEYLFKHALLRDVAYDGILRTHRRAYHARVVDWLVEVSERSGRTDEYAFLVAEHADRAEDPSAAGWYLRAAGRAASVHAPEEALRLLDRGLDVAPEDDPGLRFDLLAAREEVLDREGDRDGQQLDVERMEVLLGRLDAARRVRLHLARARLDFDTSRYDEAVRWATAAVEESTAGDEEALARGRLLAGKAFTWAGDAGRARTELAAAIEVADAAGLDAVAGEALRYLGMIAGNEGDYAGSLERLAAARLRFAAAEDPEGEGRVLVQESATLYNLGRLAESRTALEAARPAFSRSRYRYGEALVLGNLATIAAGQGELGAALGWVVEAVEATRRLRDVEAVATNLGALAEIEVQLGRLAAAEAHGLECAELAAGVSTDSLRAHGLSMAAAAASAAGRHDDARRLAGDAVEAGRTGHEPRAFGAAQQVRGQVLAAAGAHEEAAAAFAEAGWSLEGLGVDGLALQARAGEAASRAATGDVERALALVEPVLAAVAADDLGGAQPEPVWRACLAVLDAARDPQAPELRADVRQRVEARARLVGADVEAEYRAAPVVRELLEGASRGDDPA
ncbi:ATP-binding protein [Phycicoccus sonneratiae]|uniref:AAA family ATPase n=1 Tax=Phycicoccus sonneratiae TaxID=2807628 RepID=A0ABS2CQI7_9MICO|nr:adenylate/guanylate cyclase domain-containing protein [Phycicoccus sonneraticus]MBM6402136.1 AAA family ATPase [Phycicoccus sonneraticus]